MTVSIWQIRLVAVTCTLSVLCLSGFYFATLYYSKQISSIHKFIFDGKVMITNTCKTVHQSSQYFEINGTSKSNEKTAMTKILLFTYYRGGSSFLGQIFAQNIKAFYFFEPLHNLNVSMSKYLIPKNNGLYLVDTDYQLIQKNSPR
jgi:hypothetical protein